MNDKPGKLETAVDSVAKIANVVADETESTLVNTMARIADTLDRMAGLLEDLAAAVELPALNRDAAVYEEDLDEEGED